MHKDNGQILKEHLIPTRDDRWSESFKVGDEIDFKGVPMVIVRIKQLRKEIHLKFKE